MTMPIHALIVAAGRGSRAPGDVPKQFRDLGGIPVLRRSLDAFAGLPGLASITAVIAAGEEDRLAAIAPGTAHAIGGASRAESVLAGLRAVGAAEDDAILIHDAARPLVPRAVIERVAASLARAGSAVPTLPAIDAMRRVEEGRLVAPVPREGIHRIQTPQGFRYGALLAAMEEAERAGTLADAPDEATLMGAAGHAVVAVPGDPINLKLTVPEDFTMAERLLSPPAIRVGQGFDVHAFGPGDRVVLCGVAIPFERGLAGHSDADVGLHALTDALLGAVAAGDIGRHFPPSDEAWRGADSALFLRRALGIAGERGYRLVQCDVTLICERPKIGPHADAMIARIADICALPDSAVSVKATTTERLGFCGRGEGIAAQAVATVERAP